MMGEVRIGKRIHIASFVNIGSREPVIIDDYVAIGASSKFIQTRKL